VTLEPERSEARNVFGKVITNGKSGTHGGEVFRLDKTADIHIINNILIY